MSVIVRLSHRVEERVCCFDRVGALVTDLVVVSLSVKERVSLPEPESEAVADRVLEMDPPARLIDREMVTVVVWLVLEERSPVSVTLADTEVLLVSSLDAVSDCVRETSLENVCVDDFERDGAELSDTVCEAVGSWVAEPPEAEFDMVTDCETVIDGEYVSDGESDSVRLGEAVRLCVRLSERDDENDVDPASEKEDVRLGSFEELCDILFVADCSHELDGVKENDSDKDNVTLRLVVWEADLAEAVSSEDIVVVSLGTPESVSVELWLIVFEEDTSFVVEGPDLVGDSDTDADWERVEVPDFVWDGSSVSVWVLEGVSDFDNVVVWLSEDVGVAPLLVAVASLEIEDDWVFESESSLLDERDWVLLREGLPEWEGRFEFVGPDELDLERSSVRVSEFDCVWLAVTLPLKSSVSVIE
jgi:hypothetical protein